MEDTKNPVSIVEGATRYWLEVSVMVSSVLLVLFLLDIQDSRNTIANFPATFNSSCHSSVYYVQEGLALTLISLTDDAQNITNTEYLRTLDETRTMMSQFVGFSVNTFLFILKRLNPILYCGIDGGLQLTNGVENTIEGLSSAQFSCNIPDPIPGVQICNYVASLEDQYNSLTSKLQSVVNSWPTIPTDLDAVFETILNKSNIYTYVQELSTFAAPPYILDVNSSQVVNAAFANSASFLAATQGCTEISVKFTTATVFLDKVLFWVEFALGVTVALLIIGVFVVSIVRQLPGAFVTWLSLQIDMLFFKTGLQSVVNPNALWILKYINFKTAMITTAYGILGLIVATGLVSITSQTRAEIDVWTNQSLSNSLQNIQVNIQNGIDETITTIQNQLNAELQVFSPLGNVQVVIDQITNETNDILDDLNETVDEIGGVPGVGPVLQSSIECIMPIKDLDVVLQALALVGDIANAFLDFQVILPRFTFPNLAAMGTQAVSITVSYMVQETQSRIRRYQIVFTVLTIAVGILVFQGAFFLGIKTLIRKWRERQQLPQPQSDNIQ